jgi:hypothetical protein
MGYKTEQDVLLIAGKQSGFGVVATDGKIVPIAKGAKGPSHERAKIDNDARYQDGIRREFALGNPETGAELPLIANLDYIGEPLIGFAGGFADSGAGPYTHVGVMGKTIIYHTIEESYAGLAASFYQHINQVYEEYNYELSTEGLFKPTFKTKGSGDFTKAATTFDATPTEVPGSPVEMLNWATLINGADESVVSKLTVNHKREVILAWASTSTGMKCVGMMIGELMVSGTMTCLFKDDTMWARARNQTIFALKATVTRGTSSLEHLYAEVKIRPTSPEKTSGQAVQQNFEFESHKSTSADAPAKFTLINGIASHAS